MSKRAKRYSMIATKTLEYYMHLRYTIVLIPEDDGSWGALVVELPGCMGAGDTPTEALNELEEVKQSWLLSCLQDNVTIPEPMSSPHDWFVAHPSV
jgi:predicted RNase H-like HicB family nuclease